MNAYVAEMRRRLVAKQLGARREFLQEILKEVRVRGGNLLRPGQWGDYRDWEA